MTSTTAKGAGAGAGAPAELRPWSKQLLLAEQIDEDHTPYSRWRLICNFGFDDGELTEVGPIGRTLIRCVHDSPESSRLIESVAPICIVPPCVLSALEDRAIVDWIRYRYSRRRGSAPWITEAFDVEIPRPEDLARLGLNEPTPLLVTRRTWYRRDMNFSSTSGLSCGRGSASSSAGTRKSWTPFPGDASPADPAIRTPAVSTVSSSARRALPSAVSRVEVGAALLIT